MIARYEEFSARTPTPVWWPRRILLGVWLLLTLHACAVLPPETGSGAEASAAISATGDDDVSYWWYVPVKVAWDQEQPTAWHIDVLLAHKVFKPLLLEHTNDIQMWRFHRRAARDAAGHRFSFIFYAPPATAQAILERVTHDPLLAELMNAGFITDVPGPAANPNPNPAIEATSDKNWSQAMQRAWPYFAMGVSQAWLGLIDQYVASEVNNSDNAPNSGLESQLNFYRQIDAKLVTAWQTEGGHALLHHLNALFGYGEVAIYERRLMRF